VKLHSFPVPADRRFFEDYETGQEYEFGPVTVTERDIIEFARQFDPQDFHLDPVKAASGPFRGLVASGWHTISIAMRLYVENYLSHVASLGSPGVDEVRWPAPVRPGDSLKLSIKVLETRPSRSKPDRGIVRARVEAINQRHQVALSMIVVSFLGRRRESSTTSLA
jgi:acyl dehydratase